MTEKESEKKRPKPAHADLGRLSSNLRKDG